MSDVPPSAPRDSTARKSTSKFSLVHATVKYVPLSLRWPLVAFFEQFILFVLLRVAFWASFSSTAPPASFSDRLNAFFIGVRFDIRLALGLVLPPAILGLLHWLNPVKSRRASRLWSGWMVAVTCLTISIYAADFAHYDWTSSRINVSVLEHIEQPTIALKVAWESYPVVWFVIGVGVFGFVYAWSHRWVVRRILSVDVVRYSRGALVCITISCILFVVLGLMGRVARYPLRWSMAYSTSNPFTSALGLNPVLYLMDTWPWRVRGQPYDLAVVREHYEEVAKYLGVEKLDASSLSFIRHVPARDNPWKQPNIVIVFLESLGANKASMFGNPLRATPHLDGIAAKGILFRNFFVGALPTGRSIFTVITGIPDVNPYDPATNNPLLVSQRTIVNEFQGYRKLYFYTGDLSWANLRALLKHNVPDMRIYEQTDYTSPPNDGWGISDLDLFLEADRVFSVTTETPFLAFIQTSGNHPPWTIPKDKKGFHVLEAMEVELARRNDIRHLEELNALRFLDYSVGHFFEAARHHPYFQNTIFMFLGDHGARGTGSNPWETIGLVSGHVPFIIYAPGLSIEPRVVETLSNSMDVLPTAAGLAGLSYENATLGRDLLEVRADKEYMAIRHIGLVGQEYYYADNGHLYAYRSDHSTVDVSPQVPEKASEMRRRWTGFLETARYMLYHNRRQ